MAYYSTSAGQTTGVGSSYLDNPRRYYDFGDTIASLKPKASLFFSYLAQQRKVPVDDPKFMFLEERHQWHRRNFEVHTTKGSIAMADPITVTDLQTTVMYDKYGRTVNTDTCPVFFVVDDTVIVEGELDTGSGGAYEKYKIQAKVTALGTAAATNQKVTLKVVSIDADTDYATTYAGKTLKFVDGALGQTYEGSFGEATGAPDGWEDQLYDGEGFVEITKTSCNVVSGTAMATRYRGIPNEWDRIWGPKLMQHKKALSFKTLFGTGRYEAEDGTEGKRYTWGLTSYAEKMGNVTKIAYSKDSYDDFMEFLRVHLEPETMVDEVPIAMTSRKVLSWLDALRDPSFISNTFPVQGQMGPRGPLLSWKDVTGQFGHELSVLRFRWGTIAFSEEVSYRGLYEDYCQFWMRSNTQYRPLAANGVSRDTFIKTNVQGNDIDGRKDLICTEAGLRIDLIETHPLIKFV